MANIIDYVKTEMRTLPRAGEEPGEGERAFGDIDSLVLSQLSYVHLPASVPRLEKGKPALGPDDFVPLACILHAEDYDSMFPTKGGYSSLCALVTAMAASPRFRGMRIGNYVWDEDSSPGHEKQFAAVCAALPDGRMFVSFRGSEDSLAAWKENFNMAFTCPIPAQTAAADYLRRATGAFGGRIVVGGHSKGGNLAVYSAMKADDNLLSHIDAVYSHDGPGFEQRVLDSLDFARVRPLVHKTVPEASVIGMIFETQEDFTVVESSGRGIAEHFAMTWKVENGDFVRVPALPGSTRYVDRTLNEWVASVDRATREQVLDALFGVLQSTGCETFSQMSAHWRETLPAIREAVKGLDPEVKRQIVAAFKVLFSTALRVARGKGASDGAAAVGGAEGGAPARIEGVGRVGDAGGASADAAARREREREYRRRRIDAHRQAGEQADRRAEGKANAARGRAPGEDERRRVARAGNAEAKAAKARGRRNGRDARRGGPRADW